MKSNGYISDSIINSISSRLPSLEKHNYRTLDTLIKKLAAKHKVPAKVIDQILKRKYGKPLSENANASVEEEVHKFIEWASDILHIKSKPEFELSTDTEEAQDQHHTGSHMEGSNKVWVYVKNRNLVDILRTVFHELVHVRQSELGMIHPGSSYPGSPIEVMADMLAGKYIKIYGEKNHHIFQ